MLTTGKKKFGRVFFLSTYLHHLTAGRVCPAYRAGQRGKRNGAKGCAIQDQKDLPLISTASSCPGRLGSCHTQDLGVRSQVRIAVLLLLVMAREE